MRITDEIKELVVNNLLRDMAERKYSSQAEYAKYIQNLLAVPFDKAAFSSIKKVSNRNMLKDSTWLKIAMHFNLMGDNAWTTAETHTYLTMQAYLNTCKKHGVWRVLCDHASFGKTYASTIFAEKNKDSAFYINCSDCQSKSEFISELARQLGVAKRGTFNQLWKDVTDELLLIEKPLLILDEFGDVHDGIITLLKALYNKANMGDHNAIGVLHIGADNLQKRMADGRRLKKPSYAEYWSRFGDDILTLNYTSPDKTAMDNQKQLIKMLGKDIELITDLNLPEHLKSERDSIVNKSLSKMNLRVIRDSINIKSELASLNAN